MPILLLLVLALAACAEDDLDRKVLESEAWRRGDYVGLFDEWLALAAANPEAPQVEVVLRAWKNVEVFVPDPTAYLPRLRELDGALSGPNAFHLRRNVARLLDETGDHAAALTVRARDGDLSHWRVSGPYGRTDAASFETSFAPERGADCSWRPYPGLVPVVPSRYLRPLQGAAYALCQVRAEADADAFLWVECGGPLRVWWNEGLLPDVDRFRAWLPRTLVAPVRLSAGWNRVVVKSLLNEEGFRVRLLDARGEPLALAEEEGTGLHPCGAPARDSRWSTWGALAAYEAVERESGWAASMRAFLLSEEEVPDRALAAGVRSVELLPKSAHVACLLGELYDTAEHVPESERRNRAKDWYDKALAIDPSFVPALEDLALYYKRDHHADKALDALRRASEINPTHFAGPLLSSQILQDEGWGIEARHALEELERRAAGALTAAEGLAMESVVLGNYPQAKERFEALSAKSTSARRQIAALAKATGDLEGTIAFARAEVGQDLSDPGAHAALAEALADAGRTRDALDAYGEAWKLVPEEASYPRRMGELFLRSGRDEEGIALLEKALSIDPSDGPSLALLAELRGESEEPPEAYRLDAVEAMRAAPRPIGAPVDHLFRQVVVRFRADGSATVWTHQAIRLNTQEAVEAGGAVGLEGAILEARNLRPDGKVLSPSQIGQGGTLTMPGLVPGSVIETRFRREVPPAPEGQSLSLFFHDTERSGPVTYVRFAIEWPESLGLVVRERGFDRCPVVRRGVAKAPNGWKAVVWEAEGLPMLERQSKSPPDTDLLPYVMVAERRTWAEVVETMRESLLGQARVTEEIRRVAEPLLKKAAGPRQTAEAAYRFAQGWVKDTESFGDAQSILSTRSGSILTLTAAVLDAMGVRYDWVAVRPREDLVGEAVWDVPRSDVFSAGRVSPLLRVPLPDGALWLSGDARLLGAGQVSELAQGGDGLILDPRQPRFVTIPSAPPSASGNTVALEGELSEDGTLVGKVRLDLRGVAAAAYKDRLLGVEGPQRKMIFQTLLANFFLGFQLEEMELPGLGEAGSPLSVEATFRTPSFGRMRGGRMEVPLPAPRSKLRSNFCQERERTVPLRIPSWEASRTEAVIRIPDGWRVGKLPEDVLLQGEIGRLAITWRMEGDAVRVRHELEIGPQVMATEKYPELVRFCQEGDAAEEARMELVR